MRYVFIIVSLTLACGSIAVSHIRPDLDSRTCRVGFCSTDQIAEFALSGKATPARLSSSLAGDASDRYLWSAYASSLADAGDPEKAAAAFDHAVSAGPNLPQVLLRAAYFDLSHRRLDRGETLTSRILRQTPDLDAPVFSYLLYFAKAPADFLGNGIPAERRPAVSWSQWIAQNGSDPDVRASFEWLMRNHLVTSNESAAFVSRLWERRFYATALALWTHWHAPAPAVAYPGGQLLSNRRFETPPDGSPFDWSIPTRQDVQIRRKDGLQIRFLGNDNIVLEDIKQSTVAGPGHYRFDAVVESSGLTTDQRPYFRIFDAANPARLDVRTPEVVGTTARTVIGCRVVVLPGTQALTVELARRASERFDNKIAGTLHVYEVSLVPEKGSGG